MNKAKKTHEKVDDTIVIDTGSGTQIVEHIETFDLVPETDPILKEVLPEFDFDNAPINAADFASSMVETCIKNNGFGLSANQCGFPYRMFVMGAGQEYVAFFNPKVVKTEGEVHMQEACLSYPGLSLRITRPEKIWVEYQDYNGEKKEAHYIGMSARCFLHELDHMNGIVYTEKAKPLALQSGLKKRAKLTKMMTRYFKAQNKMVQATQ
jgi:peptide deformylase